MCEHIRIGIDIGGTFTDIAVERGEDVVAIKTLTTHDAPEEGVIEGLLDALKGAGCGTDAVSLVVHGTTLATNALIERKGARTALLTTEGFRDVIAMRGEDRYEQYDLTIAMPEPLVPRRLRFAVGERMDASGRSLRPLDEQAVTEAARQMAAAGVEAVAVGFLHSYANPAHERAAARILARHLPDATICLSSEVAPEIREYERFSTTVANAYVRPLMDGYLARLERRLGQIGILSPLLLMLSGGGLASVQTARRFPIRLVESGPAGGVAFATALARRHQLDKVLSFDMGGTTAKLSLLDHGRPRTARSFEVARIWRFRKGSGLPLRIPVIEMVEIGAGGGSLAGVDALGCITVGPRSAGSEPGPACYDRGGTGATVTDADLVLGRMDAERFAGGRVRLVADAAEAALTEAVGAPLGMTPALAALGVSEMVEESMATAARVHAIEEGTDIAGRTMIAFGGAAPLHAASMARKLGIERVLIPRGAGIGSAIGFLNTPVSYEVMRSMRMPVDAFDAAAVAELLDSAEREAAAAVRSAQPDADLKTIRRTFMRYQGQGHEIEITLPEGHPTTDGWLDALCRSFEATYTVTYDRTVPDARPECISFAVAVQAAAAAAQPAAAIVAAPISTCPPEPVGRRLLVDPDTGRKTEVNVYLRDRITVGGRVHGPALIVEDATTTVLPQGFEAIIGADGVLDCRLTRMRDAEVAA